MVVFFVVSRRAIPGCGCFWRGADWRWRHRGNLGL